MNPTKEQEQQWEDHKQQCYQRWRKGMLERAAQYLESASSQYDEGKRIEKIRNVFGTQADRFMRDLFVEIDRRKRVEH